MSGFFRSIYTKERIPLKKLFIILTLLVASILPTMAQYEQNIIQRLPQVDNKRWHFGFILGMNLADFTTAPNTNWVDKDGNTWYSASAGLAPEFAVGMIVDLRLVEYLNLRFTPTLGLGQRNVSYTCYTPEGVMIPEKTTTIPIQTTTIDVPFYLKYSARRYGNVRPYIIVGGGPQFNVYLNPEDPILLNPVDVQISFGIGMNIYTEYFKLCPEIKFGFGLLDQLNQNHPEIEGTAYEPYTRAVEKLTSRVLSITFNFE